jgi:CubicO group peptidase (beta-lactamase class C family)
VAGSGGLGSPGTGGTSLGGRSGAEAGGTSTGGISARDPCTPGAALGAAPTADPMKDYLGDPCYPDDFWRPTSFDESGVDPKPFDDALQRIATEGWEVHSFLVAYHGRLLFEHYGWKSGTTPGDPDTTAHQVLPSERAPIWSVTKSVTSALVGIALGEGAIAGVDTKVADWFPDYASLNPTPEKSSITLEDLLTMRSGLAFTEGEQELFSAPDPARAMLARDVTDTPVGTVWNYSTGAVEIITEILRVATGTTPLEYAKTKLFGPIGIEGPPWEAGATGTNHGGFGLSLTPREMARFGELYRNDGIWADKQIVPRDWTTSSTTAKCASTWGMDYGYLWFIPGLEDFFAAIGMNGQEIFVSRARGLVIVFTGNVPSSEANSDYSGLVRDFLLPALG